MYGKGGQKNERNAKKCKKKAAIATMFCMPFILIIRVSFCQRDFTTCLQMLVVNNIAVSMRHL